MHSAGSLLPHTPIAASIITRNIIPNPKTTTTLSPYNIPSSARKSRNSHACKASSSSSSCSSSIMDFDLYDLLGVDSSCDQSQIKLAYRGLQKRCHPDIAGAAGHEMAIILNEVYSLLSDPNSRFAYDKEHAKIAALRGFSGKPIYSVWLGSESEERAVFVDEVKCVGCLKCALLAEKTFAVESVYGRARVVAQWADPENKIQEAIEACPVDCISFVEKSNLAALEFLMSKQPRGTVRIGAGNAVGTRVSNIFSDVEKFQARFQDAMDKAGQSGGVSESEREARSSAIQAIRSISNWMYWQAPGAGGRSWTSGTGENLIISGKKKSTQPNIKKLKDAAAAIKHARENGKPTSRIPSNYIHNNNDEYWIPSTLVLPEATGGSQDISGSRAASGNYSAPRIEGGVHEANNVKDDFTVREDGELRRNPFVWGVPMATATVAALIVRLQAVQVGVSSGVGGLEEHVGGSLVLGIINSSWSQVILAAITWYLITTYMVELVQAFRNIVCTKK